MNIGKGSSICHSWNWSWLLSIRHARLKFAVILNFERNFPRILQILACVKITTPSNLKIFLKEFFWTKKKKNYLGEWTFLCSGKLTYVTFRILCIACKELQNILNLTFPKSANDRRGNKRKKAWTEAIVILKGCLTCQREIPSCNSPKCFAKNSTCPHNSSQFHLTFW